MKLYYDIEGRKFRLSRTDNREANSFFAKRGDDQSLRILPMVGENVHTYAGLTEMVFAVKSVADDSTPLLLADTFTRDGSTGEYVSEIAQETAGIEVLLAASEDDFIDVYGEFSATDTTYGKVTSKTVDFRIYNDFWKGTEGTPLTLPTPDEWLTARAVRYDEAQTLSSPQKTQSLTNIGAAPALGSDDNYVTDAEKSALHAAATVSGNGISISGQQISLSIGTGSTQVAAGDDSRFTNERVPTAAGLTSKFTTAKVTIADGDKFAGLDSAASDVPKHWTWSVIKSALATYFGGIYAALVHTHVSVDVTDATSDGSSGSNKGKILKTDDTGHLKVGDIRSNGLYGNTYSDPARVLLGLSNGTNTVVIGNAGTIAVTSDITGTNSGTNTGDQTSIVGITGTLAQFNTAVTDADLASLAGSETLTNKRTPPRITTITSSATPTVNTDNCDMVTITALAAAITSMTSGLSGTPTNGEMLLYRIKDNGTARAITWGASFEAVGASLPTTTVLSKRLTVLFIWDSVTSKWGCLSTAHEA